MKESAGAESILMDPGVFLSCFMPPAHQANTKYQSNEGRALGCSEGGTVTTTSTGLEH